ncbi:sigma-70 family RNA polymerase sigma factor [Streptomyces sp. NBC_00853]|uniref:RNA polymerase sigma factor n=1 Tax=Streptomyces sp. NBC_00853 TaxID=2903681 RepID=UPI0038736998|nr:sigma-70 family RNA polymerase sigma factor [Streptomyces sp. NBC_00853]
MTPMPVPPSHNNAKEVDGDAPSTSLARLEDLFHQLQPQMVRQLHYRFPALTWSDAEDVVSEAFLYANRHWDRIGDLENLRAYLNRAATNRAIDILRRQRRVHVAEDDTLAHLVDQPQDDRNADSEVRAAVRQAIANMTPGRGRQVITLQEAGLSDVEIAAILGITANQLYVQRSRAIKILKRRLASYIRNTAARSGSKPQ